MDEISPILKAVDPERIKRDLFYLSRDPLPCRTLDYTVSGHDRCTLYEADDFIIQAMQACDYVVEQDVVKVQAFVPDQHVAWGFRKPLAEEPWYDAVNILAKKPARKASREVIVVLAHKDSQSWLDCAPGAYDNAVGVASLLELARVLRKCELEKTLLFLFCNEEHWPWTSVQAVERLKRANLDVLAAINVDSIAGKAQSDADAGRMPNLVRYSTPEGERIADLAGSLNAQYGIGLEHRKVRADCPNDDDGSFINAGMLRTVLFIGSCPYADPNYHTLGDTPEKVDIENVTRATQLVLATVLTIGRYVGGCRS